MKILNKRDSEKFVRSINLPIDSSNYVFVENNKKYYIVSKDISKVDLSKLNIKKIGLYFGEFVNNKFVISEEAEDLFLV